MNPVLRQAYRQCARITRQHGTTYYWGVRLLAPEQRNDVYAVYALCRTADDIVDADGATSAASRDRTAAALADFGAQFTHAVRTGRTDQPVLAAASDTARRREIPAEAFDRFFAAMTQDLTVTSYDTFEDLLGYMDGSAAVIGEMMLPILHPTTPQAHEPARSLGIAFQLTNFLRDVQEDARRGRTYLPLEDFDRFGVPRDVDRVDDNWRALMAHQIERNRQYYRHAVTGLAMLPGRSSDCVRVAAQLYSEILDKIEQADYDVFSGRHRVPLRRKAGLAATTLLRPTRSTAGALGGTT